MVTVHLGPQWFFGVDACLEALISLVALCVAFASWRVYRALREKKYAYFTFGMFLLTLSFLARAVTDALIEGFFWKIPEAFIGSVFFVGYVLHILLALSAYLILFIITHKIVDKRVMALLFVILLPSLLLSGSYYMSFYGISLILLAFVAFAYCQNFCKVRSCSACFVFVSFLLLALSQGLFLLEMFFKPLYAVAQVAQAVGYVLLLIALIKILLK